jgi:branched-chain amino acid transport system substrate-binding protein
MKKRISLQLVIVLLFSFFSVQSCTKETTEKTMKIGAILPMTGSLAFMGELEKNGMEIAFEEIEEKDIKIFYEDSEGKAQKGLSSAQNLLNIRGADIIITSGTAVSRSVTSLHERLLFIQSAFCMDPTIHKEHGNILRLYYGMEQEAQTIIDYFYGLKKEGYNLNSEGIGILSVNHQGTIQQINDYFKPGFEEIGIPIKFIETYEFSQKDFKNIMAKIANEKINRLIIIGYGFVYPEIFKNLEQYELLNEIEIVGGWGFIANNNLSAKQLEGVIVASPECMIVPNEKYKVFEKSYIRKFNSSPNFESALAYENIMLFYNFYNEMNELDPEKIRNELLGKKYESILGETIINADGRMSIPIRIARFNNGKLELLIR